MRIQKIFFSYSRIDGSDFALKLALDLKEKGFDVWIDQEDIRAGSEWDIEIEKALETCDCVLFIETEKSVLSNNVLDEVYYALEQQKKVIPLILVDSKTPFRLMRLQHIDFSKKYETGLAHLLNELEGNASTPEPITGKTILITQEPIYKRYAGLILLLAVVIIITAAIFIFTAVNKTLSIGSIEKTTETIDTALNAQKNSQEVRGNTLETLPANDTVIMERQYDNEKPLRTGKKLKTTVTKSTVDRGIGSEKNTTDHLPGLNETFAGDWQLFSVEPKAQSVKGYLKITEINDKEVAIKSYMQFYYFKTNATAYPTIFNAFAGCTSCKLAKEMKMIVEDVAIGSQVYKILEKDGDNGKTGDTIMQAGSNKSLHASVTLQLINSTHAVIKVQRTTPAILSNDVVLQPFTYTFLFTKDQ